VEKLLRMRRETVILVKKAMAEKRHADVILDGRSDGKALNASNFDVHYAVRHDLDVMPE
jgi:hypothetical protein